MEVPRRSTLAKRHIGVFKVCVCTLAIASFTVANAGLILNPIGGSTIFGDEPDDDATVHVELDSTFALFGESFSSLHVSTNGNLNFSANSSFDNTAFPSVATGPMISPFWDDLLIIEGSHVTENRGAGWFAVTWRNVASWADLDSKHTFQVLLFSDDKEFGGFQFHAGDIAFAYGPLGAAISDSATVGLNGGPGTEAAGIPDDGDTIITIDELVRLKPGKTDFILFRPEGDGYEVSYESTVRAVPEPATAVILGLGALGFAWRRRRERRA